MPKEGITDIVKIVYLIAVVSIFQNLLLWSFDDFSWEDSPLKVDSIGNVDFAIVDKIMSSLEMFDSLLK